MFYMAEDIKMPDNLEIDQALKEFEIKSQAQQTEKVAEISKASKLPKMVQLVIKYSGGSIKDLRQAEWVLFGFAILVIVVSFFIYNLGNNSITLPDPDAISLVSL